MSQLESKPLSLSPCKGARPFIPRLATGSVYIPSKPSLAYLPRALSNHHRLVRIFEFDGLSSLNYLSFECYHLPVLLQFAID
jgi:hypothetical protein